MEAILGKLYSIFFLVSVSLYGKADSLVVKMFDTQHQEIKQAGIGQPFTLEVVLKGDAVSYGQPVFENLEQINGRRSGYQMNSINGDATVIYTYQGRVDKEGVYAVGPIRVGNFCVDSFTITIGHANQLVNPKKGEKQKILLQFFIDSHDVVIGEKIACRLRFLYNNDLVALKHIGQQEIPGFQQALVEGPSVGTDNIDGKLYHYKEWRWILSPIKEGNYLIPAHYADYTVKNNRHAFWGGFAHLFDDHDVKRIYSNAEKVVVHAFDDAPYPVCAVGKNIAVTASVDSAVVRQSEGITLRIDIAGDEKSSLRTVESLANMPQELKWYRSNGTNIDPHTLRSEFIIQGLKSGDYEIPAQKLCYFDHDTREYKIITTQPLVVSITPLRDPLHHTQPAQEPVDMQLEQEKEVKLVENQLPLAQATRWYTQSHRSPLPWWIFIIIVATIVVCSMITVFISLFEKIFYYKGTQKEFKNAFTVALRGIHSAQHSKNNKQLYGIFIKLLSIRCALPKEQVSPERIEHELYNRFVDDATRVRWKHFFNTLERAMYGRDSFDNDQLFAQAVEWVSILKKIM